MNYRRRTVSLSLAILMLLQWGAIEAIPQRLLPDVMKTEVVQAAPTVNIGDYIQFGTYNSEPIVWRVIHKDENGDPMLFSDRILTLKSFDAAGPYHTDSSRQQYGSNYYPDSNLRQWLNSTQSSVTWTQNRPSKENLYHHFNAYDTEAGFISDGNFTATERNLMKPLTYRSPLTSADTNKKDGGTESLNAASNYTDFIHNSQTTSFYKTVTDSVFLLNAQMFKTYVYDRGWDVRAYPTKQAVAQSRYKSSLSDTSPWYYWLNMPYGSIGIQSIYKDGSFLANGHAAIFDSNGIRPALQLKLSSAVFVGGSGTAASPYIVDRGADRQPPTPPGNLSASGITSTTLNLSWTPATDNIGIAGYEIYQGSTLLTTVSGSVNTFAVSGLADQTTYSFTIRARDYKLNRSQPSAVLSVTTSSIKIGDYVRMGTYYGAPILWRIIHKDANGDPVLLSDRILTIKPFDAAGDFHTDANRKSIGSNNWQGSNLRQWLNSYEPKVPWIQNPPHATNLEGGWNPYHDEKGFLANGNFSASERALIKPSTNKTLLAPVDSNYKDGGTETHTYNEWVYDAVQNYDQVFFKNVTDRVFLLSVKQIKEWIYDNRAILGNHYQRAIPTPEAIANSTHNFTSIFLGMFNSTTPWYQWTGTPMMSPTSAVRVVGTGGEVIYSTGGTDHGNVGVRPAMHLHIKHSEWKSGTGTSANPYVLDYKNYVDRELPTAPNKLYVSNLSSTGLTLNWSASLDNDAITAYEVYRGSTLLSDKVSSTGYLVSGLLPNTAHTFTVRAKDAAGNKSLFSASLNVTTLAAELADTTAPTVPAGFAVSGKTATGFTVTWKPVTDTGGSGLDGYELFVGDSLTPFATMTTPRHMFTGLKPLSTTSILVRAFDKAGNLSDFSVAYSVTTLADRLAPAAPTGLTHDEISSTGFRLKWLPSTDQVGVAGYEVFMNGLSKGKTSATEMQLSNLEHGKTYSLTVRAYDEAGNVSPASAVYLAITYSDQEAPSTPEGLVASGITSTGFTVSWEPSADNQTVAGYKVFLKKAYQFATFHGTSGEPEYEFTGLEPGVTYQVTIKTFDAAGAIANESALSEPLTVTTPSDSGAPTFPEELQAHTILGNSFVLTWEASTDDIGVEYYEIYRDGILFKTNQKSLSLIVDELIVNTAYSMTVRAVDKFGLKSESSEPLIVTTTDATQAGPALSIVKLNKIADKNAILRYSMGSDAFMVIRVLNPSNHSVLSVINNMRTKAGTRTVLIPTKSIKGGKYYVQMIARDPLTGHRSIVYKNITIDHTAPSVTAMTVAPISETGTNSTIAFKLSEKAYVTVIAYQGKFSVRTIAKRLLLNGGANTVQWSGRDRRNRVLTDGTYRIEMIATDMVGLDSKIRTANMAIERAAPVVSGVSDSPELFAATGAKTSLSTIRYSMSERAKMTVKIYDSSNQEVRTLLADGWQMPGSNNVTWNGRNTAGALVDAGNYTYKMTAIDAAGKSSAEISGTISLVR